MRGVRLVACFRRAPCWQSRLTSTVAEVGCQDGLGLVGGGVKIPSARFQMAINAEVAYLATQPREKIGLGEILDCKTPAVARKMIERVAPARWATRISLIESLDGWREIPELVRMKDLLQGWYIRMTQLDTDVHEMEFSKLVKDILEEGKPVVQVAAQGIAQLESHPSCGYTRRELDDWLDKFLLSRIGTRMLLQQFVAVSKAAAGSIKRKSGIVDLNCDAVVVCEQAADYAQDLCMRYEGRVPRIEVKAYHSVEHGAEEVSACHFSYIPSHLRYIMLELLKNSFSATIKVAENDRDLFDRVVRIVITSDDQHVKIRVRDQAKGIPESVSKRLFSYTSGAAARKDSNISANALAGFGVGLPLSRLHAWRLGGDLNIWSYPGIGTDAMLTMRRVKVQQD
mmetsp:Transcript_30837/g.70748  ORF Transcript_30837/g.70748 Transcript_30837/m.70748 type:complete len:398 (-) Transcript_30837:135-1328(-)